MRRMYRVRWPEGEEVDLGESEDNPRAVSTVSRNASQRWKAMRTVAATAVGKMRGNGGPGPDDEDEGSRREVAEELGGHQSTTAFFAQNFVLPVPLARAYTRLVFLSHHRLQVSGKRLTGVTYDDTQAIAHILMERWCWRVGEEPHVAGLASANVAKLERHLSSSTLERHHHFGTIGSVPLVEDGNPLSATASAFSPYDPAMTAPPTLSLHLQSPIARPVAPGTDDDIGDALDLDFIGELRSLKPLIADQRRLLDDYVTCVLLALREPPPTPARAVAPSPYATPSPVAPSPTASATALSGGAGESFSFAGAGGAGGVVGGVALRPVLLEKLRPRILPLVRSLLSIAVALSKPKKVRLLLLDLVDEVCRPLAKLGLTGAEMTAMMEAIAVGWEGVGEVKKEINLFRGRMREGLGRMTVGGGSHAYGDEAARAYVNWMRFLSAVVPITLHLTASLYRRGTAQ